MMLKILCLQQNKPFLYRKLSFQVPFHAPGGAGGEASKNFFSFFPAELYKNIFTGNKNQEKCRNKKKLHNYTQQVKSMFICQSKKTILKMSFKNSI